MENGQIIRGDGARWIDFQGVAYFATGTGVVSSEGDVFQLCSDGKWRTRYGKMWEGFRQGQGQWIDKDGNIYMPLDYYKGIWIGPNSKIFRKADDGRYYAENGDLWDGPSIPTEFQTAHEGLSGSALFMSREKILIVRPRPSTPVASAPYKMRRRIRWKTPPVRIPRRIYVVPPPNIIVDKRRVRELITQGETQLMPLMKHITEELDDREKALFLRECQIAMQDRIQVQEAQQEVESLAPRPITEPVGMKAPTRPLTWRDKLDPGLTPIPPLRMPREGEWPKPGTARGVLRRMARPKGTAPRDLSNPFVVNRLVRPLLSQRTKPKRMPYVLVARS
jgi:hypothetical protein